MSRNKKIENKHVVIFGAGIAGLTAAHEFIKYGYQVSVHEVNNEAGGFFRSARCKKDMGMPSEYSWHGIGPWYHNVFSILKEIPFDGANSLYDKVLSRPIDFGIAPNEGKAQFDDSSSWVIDVKKMFRLTTLDKILATYLMMKVWCSKKRSEKKYSTINAKEAWRPLMSEEGLATWCSSFGPWVGSDWLNVSLHQAGHFFRKQLISKPSYLHAGDAEGGPWRHGSRSGWLLLNSPSNEAWFDKWIYHLKNSGVYFFWNSELIDLNVEHERISSAKLLSGEIIKADIFILAINPFFTSRIVDNNPALKKDSQLQLFSKLIHKGPHIQVSLRIAFSEKIYWPRKRCALVLADSLFDLTLFAQEQAWVPEVYLGERIESLWTVTACVSSVPGKLYGIPLEKCTKEQFIDEVMDQLKSSGALDTLIKEANYGKTWTDYPIERVEVWHEWIFSEDGIKGSQPKWVNSTNNQIYIPKQKTSFENLALAGAHTATEVDVWSIEAAVESGRRAVKIFESNVKIIPQYRPLIFKILSAVDDILFILRLPNILDVFFISVGAVIIYATLRGIY
ncbi:MAG: FAD-dependent oxidoreductase [Bacteriovorax sp.]|nr:FAD-dependent oxidoreductase [Bacteriovorax sp.]